MDRSSLDIKLVKEYLQGTLAEEQRQQIDQQLEADPLFAEEFAQQKELVESIILYHREQLKEELKSQDKKARPLPFRQSRGGRWLAMAASVVLIAISGYFLFFSNPSPEALYQQYYKPYYNVLNGVERSGQAEETGAMTLYERGQYLKAINAFESEIKNSTGNNPLIFYLGLSYLATDQGSSAVSRLKEVSEGSIAVLQEPANWYLGLAYLRQKDLDNAKIEFEKLASSPGPYQQEAEEILRDIR